MTSWVDTRTAQSERASLTLLFDKYLPVCLEKVKKGFKTITPVPEVTVIHTVLHLLECLLTPQTVPPDSPRDLYELYFVFACTWAFGGAMFQDQVCCPRPGGSGPGPRPHPGQNAKATALAGF